MRTAQQVRGGVERAERLAIIRADEARRGRQRRRLRLALSVALALVVLGAAVALVVAARRASAPDARQGVDPDRVNVTGETLTRDLARDHVPGRVDYGSDAPVPPTGGRHNEVWQNANGDVYDKPLRAEHAVHSLEHGAVWITYRADVPAGDVATLRAKVEGVPYRLMSPLPGQPGRITLTAWGHQLSVTSASDPRIEEFLADYTQGPQAPEAGAPVTGGRAEP
jgi:hypothetical protein